MSSTETAPQAHGRGPAASLRALVMTSVVLALGSDSAAAFTPPAPLVAYEHEVKAAIARIRPAVVNISAVRLQPMASGSGSVAYRSIGSGVIVNPRGYVLTNAHVIEDASIIKVRLWRSQSGDIDARLVHRNAARDLALLQVTSPGSFPCAVLGSSASVRVGDWALAIGSPYGFEQSVSLGIVSDRSRDLSINGREYRQLVQTDAAINQGNSGGPLINLRGEVVGLNTAIYAPHGAFAGVGFAIPVDHLRQYLREVVPPVWLAAAVVPAEKEAIRPGVPAPHGPLGNCSNCHTFMTTSRPAAPRTAAHVHTVAFAQGPYRSPLLPAPLPVHKSAKPARSREQQDWHVVRRGAVLIMAAAVLFNMLGIGGGFVYVPILLLLGVSFHVAAATSLFVITAAHLSGLYVFLRAGLIDTKLALLLEPITSFGAFLGGLSSTLFGEEPLSVMFGGIMLIAGYLMYIGRQETVALSKTFATRWCWERSFGEATYTVDIAVGLPLAFGAGYFGGMLGFAGGFLKVPMMVLLFGVPMKVAIATSSLMVAVTSSVGCVGHGFVGHFDARLAVVLGIAAVVGAQIGARFTIKSERTALKQVFSLMLVFVGIWMLGRIL